VYRPALEAGLHTISVGQHITPPAEDTKSKPLNLTSSKNFDVIAPRFWLPPTDIHSVYPPQGHADGYRVLPHVVFSDEHLPWERAVSDKVETSERSRVPWLALLVFTQDELRLPPEELVGSSRIFPFDVVQSTTLSVAMTLNDIWSMAAKNTIISPVIKDDPQEPVDAQTTSTKANFILVTKSHVDALFRSYNDDGTRKTQDTPDLVKYKYLAHVRNLNTEGMSNVSAVDEFGEAVDQLFSVVVAHRVGPWDVKSPTTHVAHLVTLEGIEPRIHLSSLPESPAKYVSLCSLYSWTYQCLPNDSINFFDAMVHLGQTYQPLRPPDKPDAPAAPAAPSPLVDARVRDGFSLARWRVKTGETTAAMFRGPLVPTKVPRNTAGVQSTFSTDLQILDRQLGLMNITYSLAWQLGKTMAIADQAFTAAVGRLRGIIHDQALQAVKAAAMGSRLRTATDVVAGLAHNVGLLGGLHESHRMDLGRKWKRAPAPPLPHRGFLDHSATENGSPFLDEAKEVAKQLASSLDAPEDQYWFYNEHNRPFSTDWAAMLKWILDRMYLAGLPAHYLIPDPAFLPAEALRFFSIDANWVDAFVDGALSICCHLEKEDDDIRAAIKTTIEEFRNTVDPVLGYAPQIPTYGFLLRSAVVKMFPDLVVSAPAPKTSPSIRQKMAAILRQENIDEQVMLVLLDREPGDGLLGDLTISQPPHQQCFSAAANIGIDANTKTKVFEISYDRIYTTPNQPTGDDRKRKLTSNSILGAPCPVFDWDSRMLIVENYANNILSTLQHHMSKDDFDDTVPSAALMGIQLNDLMYQLIFDLSKNTSAKVAPSLTAEHTARFPRLQRGARRGAKLPALAAGYAEGEQASEGPGTWSRKAKAKPKAKLVVHQPQRSAPPHAHLLGSPTSPEFRGPILSATPPHAPGTAPPITSIPGPSLSITCKVHGRNAADDTIPTSTGYGVDLIFAAQITGDVDWLNAHGFLLTGVFIYLPVFAGTTTTTPAPTPPPPPAGKFMAPYRGGGARMLANLRFNPLLVPSRADLFCASLFPRTASGGVDLKTGGGREMGFVLGEVEMAPYAHRQPALTVPFLERYAHKDDPGGRPVYVNSSFVVTLAPGR
jgi:hypothetical protein